MTTHPPWPSDSSPRRARPQALTHRASGSFARIRAWLAIVVAALLVIGWLRFDQRSAEEVRPHRPEGSVAPAAPPPAQRAREPARNEPVAAYPTIIKDLVIRDRNGRVAYRGDVDVQPTLERIDRGERLAHANDGATFQNRERRLPRQPSGYYREYVHPTPRLEGPGPQRVVTGRAGEAYYTPDHYRTFRRVR